MKVKDSKERVDRTRGQDCGALLFDQVWICYMVHRFLSQPENKERKVNRDKRTPQREHHCLLHLATPSRTDPRKIARHNINMSAMTGQGPPFYCIALRSTEVESVTPCEWTGAEFVLALHGDA